MDDEKSHSHGKNHGDHRKPIKGPEYKTDGASKLPKYRKAQRY